MGVVRLARESICGYLCLHTQHLDLSKSREAPSFLPILAFYGPYHAIRSEDDFSDPHGSGILNFVL